MFLIGIVDLSNKKKIINFFKSKFNRKLVLIFDIGAHKGESVKLFMKHLNIKKIYSFEPNISLYNSLINNKYLNNEKVEFFNFALGNINEKKNLNILSDTSSSTFNYLDENTKYFKKKSKIITLFSNLNKFYSERQDSKIVKSSDFIKENNIEYINILKIDTEGYEYSILNGLIADNFKKIDYIYFEHHYDLMIKKKYNFTDINYLLKKNNFKKVFKVKMKFRKTLEYIYEKQ